MELEIKNNTELQKAEEIISKFSEDTINELITSNICNEYKEGKEVIFGPPYCTGRIHSGNAAATINKDTFIRYNMLYDSEKNKKFRYALDCQGHPTDIKVEQKYLAQNLKKDQISSKDWIDSCFSLIKDNSNMIIEQLNELNLKIPVKDEEVLKTISLDYKIYMMNTIKKLYEQSNLKFGKKHFSYCPNCETTLSNAEVEYSSFEKKLYVIPLKITSPRFENYHILCATTMPLSLVNNMSFSIRSGVQYHVYEDEKKRKYIMYEDDYATLIERSKIYLLKETPLKKTSEIISAEQLQDCLYEFFLPTIDKVHRKIICTPYVYAKNQVSFNFKSSLEMDVDLLKEKLQSEQELLKKDWLQAIAGLHLSPWDSAKDLKILNEVFGETYVKDIVDYNDAILLKNYKKIHLDSQLRDSLLKEIKENSLVIFKYMDKQPKCWRCKNLLFDWSLDQIFLTETTEEREFLVDYVKNMLICPHETLKLKLINYLKHNHPWCISRSRIFGTPFPFAYCNEISCNLYKKITTLDLTKDDFEKPENCFYTELEKIIKKKNLTCDSCKTHLKSLNFISINWIFRLSKFIFAHKII